MDEVVVIVISLLMCRQRTSQFWKWKANGMEKLSKLLDCRRKWCVPGTLSYTDFVDNTAITYLPLWILVENHSELYMRMNTEPIWRGAAPRCSAQWAAAQGKTRDQQSRVMSKAVWPSWATNCSTPQVAKTLLWGHRPMAAKCCHCILAAEFVFHTGWRDIKDAIALAFFKLFHLLWENGKNGNWRGGRIPCHVVLLHKGAWLTKLSTWRLITALCGYNLHNVFLN